MKYFGVVYDVGLRFTPDAVSVDPFDPALAEHDINTIARELHANAVRIEGESIERLVTASRFAHAAGLTVFFNPWKMNASVSETRHYLAEAASAAEELRLAGADIVFLVGCELTIFTDGIYPGSSFMERGMWLGSQLGRPAGAPETNTSALAEKAPILNEALDSYAQTVRQSFNGSVTYASGLWEDVDWTPFDIVGLDYYRHAESDEEYVSGLQRHRGARKPIAVTEVGCCKYEGAGPRGDGGFAILNGVNPDGTGIFEGGVVPVRSEREQADYISTQLRLLREAEVEAVFVFEFSKPALRTGEGARDHDMASFAIVKTYPDDDPRSEKMPPWAPTEAFHRVAEIFQGYASEPR